MWTNEQRYRRFSDQLPGELEELRGKVSSSPWRQSFHIQPDTGLLNDPNGFSFFKGEYHLFYQWFPFGPVHGMKHWYHMKSSDLVHWEDAGLALEPESYFESHGVFSGSGLAHEEKLYLFYTGNTRDDDWIRTPYQCMAVMDKNGEISKSKDAVIKGSPKGYTEHFRDPKLWKAGNFFYAVIGAQRENLTGTALLYRSESLDEWELIGELQTDLKEFGFMWECPDYFEIGDHGIFLFSPQGLEADGDLYNNIYQSGYMAGSKLNLETGVFTHGPFLELDRGFDFYAPQTMLAPDGRRILIGWMGLPEVEDTAAEGGWSHCLTIPRELSFLNGKLLQKPVKELESLRGAKAEIKDVLADDHKEYLSFTGKAYEMILEFENKSAVEFGVELRTRHNEKTVVKYTNKEKKVILDRSLSGAPAGVEYGTVRKTRLESHRIKFHIFVDVSSVEVFVNDGEEVFTSRIYPSSGSEGIRFFAAGGEANFKAVKWNY
ncbi:sucrose-6-phosphate hydrolase [Metabacillus idriensis]|uniref:glycoside hydrolase family 32 protein n=1 Tax=Metabacillus idriensis TaxID=324768 RepID=UPI0028136069|nr:sucrose-6-phosphate hydrolase [Metabacillus idriensis]MDR0139229.1 sucrose-6-phosphate hydrolase [Metabacillus idriensis]